MDEGMVEVVCGDGVRRWVGQETVSRMRGLVRAGHGVAQAWLVRGFAACNVGGEAYAWEVLERALAEGVLVQEDGLVRRGSE